MWPYTINLIEVVSKELTKFVTHKFSLQNYHEAVKMVEQKRDNVLKAIIYQ